MDELISTILASAQSESEKIECLRRIIESDSGQLDSNLSCLVLSNACSWLLQDSSLHRQFGQALVEHGGKHYLTVLKKVVNESLPIAMAKGPTVEVLELIHCILSRIPDPERHFCYDLVRKGMQLWLASGDTVIRSLLVLAKLSALLTEMPMCIPSADVIPRSVLNRKFLMYLAHCEWPVSGNSISPALSLVEFKLISSLLEYVWLYNAEVVTVGLKAILFAVSNNGGVLVPSFEGSPGHQRGCCLTVALCTIPQSQIISACKVAVFDSELDGARLATSLSVLLDWLVDIPLTGMSTWVTEFMENMLAKKCYGPVMSAVLPRIEKLFSSLSAASCRPQVLPVVCHILLGVQHAPVCYQKVLEAAPHLLSRFEEEGSLLSMDCLRKLSHVFRCLRHLFETVPVDVDMLQCVNRYDHSSPDKLAADLRVGAWRTIGIVKRARHQGGTIGGQTGNANKLKFLLPLPTQYTNSSNASLVKRSMCGKAGLVNLGNTCYVNSVLQAFFMNSGFRRSLLTAQAPPGPKSAVAALQRVMAYLLLTDRQDYSPREFLEIARPSHFSRGTQQDCAEFCRHLLDLMHTQLTAKQSTQDRSTAQGTAEEKMPAEGSDAGVSPAPDFIGRHLQLKLCTTYTCKVCKHQSSRTELAYDLMVALNSVDTPPASVSEPSAKLKPPERCSEPPSRAQHPPDVSCLATPPNTPPSVLSACTSVAACTENESTSSAICAQQPLCCTDSCAAAPANPTTASQGDSVLVLPASSTTGIRGGERQVPSSLVGDKAGGATSASSTGPPAASAASASSGDGTQMLSNLLLNFLSPEVLDGDNAYECAKCQRQQIGQRQVSIVQAPEQLLVTLMRFHFDRKTQQRSKLLSKVDYPRFLYVPCCTCNSGEESRCAASAGDRHTSGIMASAAIGIAAATDTLGSVSDVDGALPHPARLARSEAPCCPSAVRYELCAVIVHSGGSTEHGHYYTLACEAPAVADDASHLSSHVSSASFTSSSSPSLTALAGSLTGSESNNNDVGSSSTSTDSALLSRAEDTCAGPPTAALSGIDAAALSQPPPTAASLVPGATDPCNIQDEPMDIDEPATVPPCRAVERILTADWADSAAPVRPWYRFSDSAVQPSSLQAALTVGNSGSDTAYMLVYNKCKVSSQSHSAKLTSRDDTGRANTSSTPAPATTDNNHPNSVQTLSISTPFDCRAIIPSHLIAEVEADNALFAKTGANVPVAFGSSGSRPNPPPPPPPGPGCGGGGFSGPTNRMVC